MTAPVGGTSRASASPAPEPPSEKLGAFTGPDLPDIDVLVFGTSTPPSGVSGMIRGAAFRYSENDLRPAAPTRIARRSSAGSASQTRTIESPAPDRTPLDQQAQAGALPARMNARVEIGYFPRRQRDEVVVERTVVELDGDALPRRAR